MKSVQNVFRLLDLFVKKERGLMFHEIESELEVAKSSLHSLLDSLQEAGALHRDPVTGQYHLTHRFVAYGRVAQATSIEEIARPFMEMLRDQSGESVSLAVIRGTEQVIVSVLEASNMLRACPAIGNRSYMHFTAVGKAMLSCLPQAEMEELISETGLTRATENTITDWETFRRELDTVRENGFALDNAEHNPAIRCVGSAIRDSSGRPIAGISIVAPAMRLSAEEARALGPHIHHAVEELGKKIGHQAPNPPQSRQAWYAE